MKKERIEFLDIARGISMLAIIAGHMGNATINQFVYTFHVPIFFVISGYLIKESVDKQFIKRKAKQLLVPYVIACSCIVLGSGIKIWLTTHSILQFFQEIKRWVGAAVYGSGTIEYTGAFHLGKIGALWFLPALFFALIIVQYFIKCQVGFIGILVCSYVGYRTTEMFWLPLSIQAGMFASILVYAGYLARKYKVLEKDTSYIMASGATFIWLICILYGGRFYVVQNYCGNGILDIIGALAGSYVIILLCRYIEKNFPNIAYMLKFYGQTTLLCLGIHNFDLAVMPWMWTAIQNDLLNRFHFSATSVTGIIWICRIVIYAGIILVIKKIVPYFYKKRDREKVCFASPQYNNRIKYWDIAKGIAIILCVLGHTDLPYYLRMIIFSFHMPLFFIANGYFIKNYDVKNTIKKSVKSLLIPYATVCLISAMMYSLQGENTKFLENFIFKIKAMFGGMSKISTRFTSFDSVWLVWFVCCLFISRNLYVIIMRVFSKYSQTLAIGVLLTISFVGFCIGKYYAYMPWSLDVAMVALIFIGVGEWTRKKNFFSQSFFWTLIIPLAVWIYFLKMNIHIELATRAYPLGILSIIEAIVGSFVCIAFSKILEQFSILEAIFSWAGKNSMIILGVHCLEMMYFPWNKFVYQYLPVSLNWFGIFCVKMLCILMVTYICTIIIKICKKKDYHCKD